MDFIERLQDFGISLVLGSPELICMAAVAAVAVLRMVRKQPGLFLLFGATLGMAMVVLTTAFHAFFMDSLVAWASDDEGFGPPESFWRIFRLTMNIIWSIPWLFIFVGLWPRRESTDASSARTELPMPASYAGPQLESATSQSMS